MSTLSNKHINPHHHSDMQFVTWFPLSKSESPQQSWYLTHPNAPCNPIHTKATCPFHLNFPKNLVYNNKPFASISPPTPNYDQLSTTFPWCPIYLNIPQTPMFNTCHICSIKWAVKSQKSSLGALLQWFRPAPIVEHRSQPDFKVSRNYKAANDKYDHGDGT